jgi:hypothetical protein
MKSSRLTSQKQRLDWLIAEASMFSGEQIELQAHWARYLCILASGFLENALAEVYSAYANSCSNRFVSSFVELTLTKIQNPKTSRFLETARAFHPLWEVELEDFMESGGRREAIDALMSNRHLIAHGKDSGITLVRVKDYIRKSIEVIEFIEAQCSS